MPNTHNKSQQKTLTIVGRPEIGHISYLWEPLVQADLLDKRGRCILARRLPEDDEMQLRLPGEAAHIDYSGAPEDVETTVSRLIVAHGQLREAARIYRQLFHTTQLLVGVTSVAHCWVAKRLASLLEAWGCLGDARNLYMAALNGKIERFRGGHWSVKWLVAKIDELNRVVGEDQA